MLLSRGGALAPALVGDSEGVLPAAGRTVAAAQRRYLTSTSPWRSRDAVRCAALAVIGLCGQLACVYGLTGEAAWRDQIGWGMGALLCLGIVVLAGVSWLYVGMREVRRGVRELEVDRRTVFDLDQETPTSTDTAGSEFVAGAGMARAHRPDCLLVKGKGVHAVPSTRELCGVCQQ